MKWFLIFILPILTSCFSNKYELIGKKKVEGSGNLYVNIYQLDEFDNVTPINFEVVNDKDSIILPRKFLTGTDISINDQTIENFQAFLHDSIFYLCYFYPQVYKIQHLDINSQHPTDSLFKKLKLHDAKLINKSY